MLKRGFKTKESLLKATKSSFIEQFNAIKKAVELLKENNYEVKPIKTKP